MTTITRRAALALAAGAAAGPAVAVPVASPAADAAAEVTQQILDYRAELRRVAPWFRTGPAMTHEAFARSMQCGACLRLMSLEQETAFWRRMCPNMTFDELVAYYERNLDTGTLGPIALDDFQEETASPTAGRPISCADYPSLGSVPEA